MEQWLGFVGIELGPSITVAPMMGGEDEVREALDHALDMARGAGHQF
jgi:hypothetical protein